MPATACRAKSNFAMIGTASHGWHGHHAAQYLWLFNRRLLNTFIEYSYIEYYTHIMNIWVPTQPLVEAFSDATHEVFHEYLRSKPNRFRFTDEKYNLFRCFLAHEEDNSRETSPVLSEYFEMDKSKDISFTWLLFGWRKLNSYYCYMDAKEDECSLRD